MTANLFEPRRSWVGVAGKLHYQGTLELIAGGRTGDGPRNRDCTAVLIPEPSNPYDANAVRVIAVSSMPGGQSGKVGYLSREEAVNYRPVIDRLASMGKVAACSAALVYDGDQDDGDGGVFGIILQLDTPANLMLDLDKDYGPDLR